MLLKLETCQEAIVKIRVKNAGSGRLTVVEEREMWGALGHDMLQRRGERGVRAVRVTPGLPSAAEWAVGPHCTEGSGERSLHA